ncbi:MAG: HEAT repeat domain-containing protein [Sedimentisphaerales bacterium]|nr:HEAT repeat domain-containing protein [Sedimentisphaerales bacterium]
MSAARLLVLISVLAGGLLQAAQVQETTAPPVQETELERQIRVNKRQLLEGTDEQTRVDAATLLLSSETPEARREVLRVLRDETIPQARAAVCRALILARENKVTVAGKVEFIEPLMAVLKTETDAGRAELAAQAMLMFTYDDIQKHLDSLFVDPNVSKTAQVNAIRALKYEPDDRAIFKLVSLLESADAELAAESRKALELLGIEVPSDPNGLRALTEALQRRGPEAFLRNPLIMRNWLVSRENRIVELRNAVTAWEQRYETALGRLYALQADEKAKSEFLAQQLGSSEPTVKLWALRELENLRKGTSKFRFSEQLESMLLSLISNRDKRVRLNTVALLARMRELDSTKQILDQLQVEEDPEVRHGLFVALGGVCYYASMPTSTIKVPEDIRKRTLELAVGFLNLPDPAKMRSGADVIGKLLEQDGLTREEVDRYLKALAEKYQQISPTVNHGLRGELLGVMAGLCAPRSTCRTQAAGLYTPVFERALGDEADGVRQSAVDGLINIDKAAALKGLKTDFVNDPNPAVRARLVDLAGEVGGPDDLDWLSKKIGQNSEGEPAWQAMLKVLGRSGPEVVNKWMAEFDAPGNVIALSTEQKAAFLAVAEKTAQAGNDADKLKDIWTQLFTLHVAANDPVRASESMTRLLAAAADDRERAATSARLLGVCLTSPIPQIDLAVTVVESFLAERDLGPDNPIAVAVSTYLNQPPNGADPNALVTRLRQIKVVEPDKRSLWRRLLVQWQSFATARKPQEAQQVSN